MDDSLFTEYLQQGHTTWAGKGPPLLAEIRGLNAGLASLAHFSTTADLVFVQNYQLRFLISFRVN